ncbi:GNAT superfamily N-acetyltransferase [Povalibacter uvarum]|uniref:GNAT superfamily N-acetyltransferase n=1 Tax=Povalibacter uvarum TaxID=732238 RepID=A0A841HUC9_9GAMM|nr:GNAT family N-acetyltransferase [Povalibacter uvarum]MBB6095578.1 GNAT superfamily N-acetyltransferase [Povalibacter uvarum]
MSTDIVVRRLDAIAEREIRELSDVLIDCVEGGASVSFMWPMSRDKAERFWRQSQASAAKGERAIFAAQEADGSIIGTVQVVWAQAENQPHRADIAKMLVHHRGRRRGVGAALLIAAERYALEQGKTLLVLDTASSDAERLYERQGWQRCGTIPDYALMPDGTPCATVVFFKSLSAVAGGRDAFGMTSDESRTHDKSLRTERSHASADASHIPTSASAPPAI